MMSTTKPPKGQRRNMPLQVGLPPYDNSHISDPARNQRMAVATYIRAAAIQKAAEAANIRQYASETPAP